MRREGKSHTILSRKQQPIQIPLARPGNIMYLDHGLGALNHAYDPYRIAPAAPLLRGR